MLLTQSSDVETQARRFTCPFISHHSESLTANKKFIGIDLGGESGRVMVGSFDGQKIHLSEKHRFKTGGFKSDDTLRWDVNLFWEEIEKGLALSAKDEGTFESVGVDTWGVDYVLLGSNDKPLELPYHYRDSRTTGTLNEIELLASRAEIFSQTGIQFMEINTLCQLFAHSRLGGLDHADCLLTIPDFLHWKLSGAKCAEFTNATTTQCFDPQKRDWATPLLSKLGIRTDIFPETVVPGTRLATMRSEVAQATGLSQISVVVPATHDTGSAVAAVPVDRNQVGNRWAYISSGTWSLVGIETPTPILSAEALAANVTNEGGVDGTWRLLKNVMGLWLVQQTRSAFERRGFDRSYAELTQLASDAKVDCLIDPDDPLLLNPDNMETAIIKILRKTEQTVPESEGGLVRCILESLAIRYDQVLREISSLAGINIEILHIVGGGSQNLLLNQLIADATGLPVVSGPAEATVLGNLLVQCQTAGELETLDDIRTVVRNSSELAYFEPTDKSYWDDAKDRFRSTFGTKTFH